MINNFLPYIMRALVMLIVIPFHEASHAYVSYRLGDPTAKQYGRLTLNPVAHFDLMGAICLVLAGIGWAKPVPTNTSRFKNPKVGMAITAAAGPISNLMLAYVGMILYKVSLNTWYSDGMPGVVGQYWCLFLYYFVYINIVLAVFNCIPVPPFDGSRVVFLFLPREWYFKIMRYERQIFMLMFIVLMMGYLDNVLYTAYSAVWSLFNSATFYVDVICGCYNQPYYKGYAFYG